MSQPRERANGRYGFSGDWERMCTCGHALGIHAAVAPHDCFNEDSCIPGATGEACNCARFRPSRKKAKAPTMAESKSKSKLRALSDAATPGPWTCDLLRNGARWNISNADGEVAMTQQRVRDPLNGQPARLANADLIAAMRNALPAMLCALDAANALAAAIDARSRSDLTRDQRDALNAYVVARSLLVCFL